MSTESWGSESSNSWGSSNHVPATFQHRLGALALDCALALITFGIGWMIWSLVVWGEGQTPAKKILKIRVYATTTDRPATWGHMAVREFLFWLALSIASAIFAPITLVWIVLEVVWFFKDGKSRTLRDEWAKTLVVNEAA
jgi:uncharacterized RDD family membrane protein YckC